MNNDFLQTRTFRIIILALGIIIFSLIVFWIGMAVGFREAVFSVNGGQNYEHNFLGPHRPMGEPGGGEFANDHGASGEVISLNGSTIVIRGDDGTERSIVASSSTVIRQFNQDLSFSAITPNERIVAIGEPNQSGEIEAEFIRVFPGESSGQ